MNDILSGTVRRFDKGLSKIIQGKWTSDGTSFALSATSKMYHDKSCMMLFNNEGHIIFCLPQESSINTFDFDDSGSKMVWCSQNELSLVSLRKKSNSFLLSQANVLVCLLSVSRKVDIHMYRVKLNMELEHFRTIPAFNVIQMASNEEDSFVIIQKVFLFVKKRI